MASSDPPTSSDQPAGTPAEGEAPFFEAGERVRWLTYTGTVVHHRGVPYVLFDHHLDPPRAAYAVTKLQRIAPVHGLSGGEATPPPAVPPDG